MSSLFSWRPTELPDSWAPTHGWAIARVLALVAIVVVLAHAILASGFFARRFSRRTRQIGRRILLGLLATSALLSVATYLDFGVFRYGTYLNEWDFYHYYVGTKYAPELGYTNLYPATFIADIDAGQRYRGPEIRDLSTARPRDAASVAGQAASYRGRFSPERWREFVADIAWFRSQLPEQRWNILLMDHGYNGTPAWSFVVGGLFTRHLSVRGVVGRWVMLLLDPLLLLATVVVVAWAFGARPALLMVLFIGTHYLFSWGHLKGALLRTDFAMCSVLAVCLVKKSRFKLAGMLLGWAILSRIFPAFLLVGPIVFFLRALIRERRLSREWLGFFVACAATVLVLVLGSCAYFGGIDIWREWSAKISLHVSDGSDWDLGYRTIAESVFVRGVPARPNLLLDGIAQAPATSLHVVELVVLALLALPALVFVRALEKHEALAFGFVFIFLFSQAAYYYYLILCVPLLFFASDEGNPQNALGLAGMFLTGVLGYVFFAGWDPLRNGWVMFRGWRQTFPTYYFIGCLIAITVAQMVLIAASRARGAELKPDRPARE